ncbi:2-C-methyl-D-erythritol 4-phosphate cytidylyltransferase [Arcobacter sp.]|uniref:2-C-methyl-D-erythritol 4-phosphate cytidylyltransferase n=1 Tax=Arcobacter sp. TaxID=1872629 RepID=UPI003D122FB3
MIDVIYLTGGTGKRAKLGYPKQFARLKGKPIFIYGLETLRQIDKIGRIIIPSDITNSNVIRFLNEYNIENRYICKAGKTRQESVYNGLEYVKTKNVLICEAVRPFMSKDLIQRVIKADGDCVVPIDLSSASVIDILGNSYDRNDFGCVQMPQKYDNQKLYKIHTGMISQNSTDDMDLIYKFEKISGEVHFKRKIIFHGERENIKITYPIDLKIAEAILNYKEGNKIE